MIVHELQNERLHVEASSLESQRQCSLSELLLLLLVMKEHLKVK